MDGHGAGRRLVDEKYTPAGARQLETIVKDVIDPWEEEAQAIAVFQLLALGWTREKATQDQTRLALTE